MAKAVMETYPALPAMSFGTSKKEMASERTKFALALLSDSGESLFSFLYIKYFILLKHKK